VKEQDQERDHYRSAYLISLLTPARMEYSVRTRYLEWDSGSLSRYLNGTWRIPPERVVKLEAFLSAEGGDLAPIYRLVRRRR
jgi:hypothetical protein